MEVKTNSHWQNKSLSVDLPAKTKPVFPAENYPITGSNYGISPFYFNNQAGKKGKRVGGGVKRLSNRKSRNIKSAWAAYYKCKDALRQNENDRRFGVIRRKNSSKSRCSSSSSSTNHKKKQKNTQPTRKSTRKRRKPIRYL